MAGSCWMLDSDSGLELEDFGSTKNFERSSEDICRKYIVTWWVNRRRSRYWCVGQNFSHITRQKNRENSGRLRKVFCTILLHRNRRKL